MDVSGTVTGALRVLYQNRQLLNAIYQQYKLVKQVSENCDQLTKGLDEMDKILQALQKHDAESVPETGRRQASAISEYVENTRKALQEEVRRGQPSSRGKPFVRADRVS